jgi:uncharacterized protein YqgV (UPF0045/DUF77 family)
MAGQLSVARVLGDAAKIVDVWNANPEFVLGTVTKDTMITAVAELQAAHAAVGSKRTELTGLMDNRDDKERHMAELVSRVRSGIRAAFGPDSAQYEQAGCTRKSERKPRRRYGTNGSNTTAAQ